MVVSQLTILILTNVIKNNKRMSVGRKLSYDIEHYVPRLENGGYKSKKPMYFHYAKTGWKLPIHASHDPDFVLKLNGCYQQMGLDGQLIVGQIIGMPYAVCRKLFT